MSIEPVLLCFSVLVGLAVARTLPALVRFYAWFTSSGLAIATKRGYGQTASKASAAREGGAREEGTVFHSYVH